jgi:aspartate carbamoyltransferase catalytic subunit
MRVTQPGTEPAPRIETDAKWTRRHLLDVDDLTRDEIELLMETTEAMREVLGRDIPKVPALRGKNIITFFSEPSTRTRASFELAGKTLGADVINVSEKGSSVEKGELLVDTARTLEALGADIVIVRHHMSGAPYLLARELQASIINAGDGWHAHPTQALLDLYTIRRHFGEIRGRRIVIVGDIEHSRVARSNMWALTTMGAEVVLCAPTTLVPMGLRKNWGPEGLGLPRVTIESDLDKALEGADVVMALRLQKERQRTGLFPSFREYKRLYQITLQRMSRAHVGALVMHPGPVNEGLELAPEVARGTQSVINEQVSNGMAVRMALLYLLAATQSGR